MSNIWGTMPQECQKMKTLARVIEKNRDVYHLGFNEDNIKASLKGSFLYNISSSVELPVIGDWVQFSLHHDLGVIESVVPRKSVISRKVAGVTTEEQAIAANIDYVGIVQGLDGGRNYAARTLERYLTISWESGAQPLVILNKADLNEEADVIKSEAEFISPGVEVVVTSAASGIGLDILRNLICSGKTAVFIGPSGVGKSALINALLGQELQLTGLQRSYDLRGKHTTTGSKLFSMENGGIIIDSPGLKEIQLWGDSEGGIENAFEEIMEFADLCRFRDCTHEGEPGCAVQQALNEGLLDAQRYNSYLELKKELKFLENKKNVRARIAEHQRWKQVSRYVKEIKQNKVSY